MNDYSKTGLWRRDDAITGLVLSIKHASNGEPGKPYLWLVCLVTETTARTAFLSLGRCVHEANAHGVILRCAQVRALQVQAAQNLHAPHRCCASEPIGCSRNAGAESFPQ